MAQFSVDKNRPPSFKDKLLFKWELIKILFTRNNTVILIQVDKKSNEGDIRKTNFTTNAMNVSMERFKFMIEIMYINLNNTNR